MSKPLAIVVLPAAAVVSALLSGTLARTPVMSNAPASSVTAKYGVSSTTT